MLTGIIIGLAIGVFCGIICGIRLQDNQWKSYAKHNITAIRDDGNYIIKKI